ncbi:MAG: type IX secretion system membrane protein PorP/SprF [Flavobacteriales bacterium]|jgi:type IX secretion system PorP/SprF family membrane protein
MKNIVVLLFALLLSLFVKAQQLPQYTYFTYNYINYNPAVTGFTDCLELKFGVRRQWTGFEGAPRTGFANIHGKFGKKHYNYHGVGTNIETDNAGPFGYTSLFLNYAYHMRLAQKNMLSMGVGVGFMQYRISFSQMMLVNQNSDPAIAGNISDFLLPLFNGGLWLYRADRFIGLSFRTVRHTTIEGLGDSQLRRHFTLAYGKSIKMGNDVSFKPAFLLNYVGKSKASVEAQAMMDYNQKVSAGLAARSGHGLSAILKLKAFSYITLAYAYDLTLNKIRYDGASTHELTIGINACGNNSSGHTPCAAYQ